MWLQEMTAKMKISVTKRTPYKVLYKQCLTTIYTTVKLSVVCILSRS